MTFFSVQFSKNMVVLSVAEDKDVRERPKNMEHKNIELPSLVPQN